jgi:ATP-dependent protease ClpP protease subunit
MNKKRKAEAEPVMKGNDDDDGDILPSIVLPKFGFGNSASVYSSLNHVYFNDDISSDTSFALCRELRSVELRQKMFAASHGTDPLPIYLHLTTNGGEIHSAFAIVDTITQLSVPVYTVVDGFVASAGTLISLAGEKRYISKNAYMLLHELRSGVWGKMSSIEEEMENLKKVMEHITSYYMSKTKLTRKALDKLLTKDVIWNATECISKGVVDGVYSA